MPVLLANIQFLAGAGWARLEEPLGHEYQVQPQDESQQREGPFGRTEQACQRARKALWPRASK